MNAILFPAYIERVIYLVDPNTLLDTSYLHGGLAYYLPIIDRIKILPGDIYGEILGSPLKSVVFSLAGFQDALSEIITKSHY